MHQGLDVQLPISYSYTIHLKKIVTELVHETSSMEMKMLEASKYYYFISHLIFFPSIIVNTFIGAFVLTLNCTSLTPCVLTAGVTDNTCVQEVVNNSNRHVSVYQYILASLAFINAILVGAQKAIRPAENGEMFQVVARRWGALLRQMVAYKQTTSSKHYSAKKVKAFVSQFNLLVENSPLLPRWLLSEQDAPPSNDTANSSKRYKLMHMAHTISNMNLSTFLTHLSKGSPAQTPNINKKARV